MGLGLGLDSHFSLSSGVYVPPTPAIPVNVSAPVVSGTPDVGETLTCSTGSWTGYPSPTFSYDWRKDGTTLSVTDQNTYVLLAADNDGSITCRVTATNSEGSANEDSNALVVTYTPRFTVDPVVSGATTVGSVVSITAGTALGQGTLVRAYQWMIDGVDVGTDQNSYTLLAADDGGVITCEVTVTGDDAPAAVFTSAAYGTVTYPPVNTVLPVISGTSQVGETLTCTTGTWVGDDVDSFSFQWKMEGVDVGTDSSTYVPVVGDVGDTPSCVVTATGDDGSPVDATAADYTDVIAAGGGADSLLINSSDSLLINSSGDKLLIGS